MWISGLRYHLFYLALALECDSPILEAVFIPTIPTSFFNELFVWLKRKYRIVHIPNSQRYNLFFAEELDNRHSIEIVENNNNEFILIIYRLDGEELSIWMRTFNSKFEQRILSIFFELDKDLYAKAYYYYIETKTLNHEEFKARQSRSTIS